MHAVCKSGLSWEEMHFSEVIFRPSKGGHIARRSFSAARLYVTVGCMPESCDSCPRNFAKFVFLVFTLCSVCVFHSRRPCPYSMFLFTTNKQELVELHCHQCLTVQFLPAASRSIRGYVCSFVRPSVRSVQFQKKGSPNLRDFPNFCK